MQGVPVADAPDCRFRTDSRDGNLLKWVALHYAIDRPGAMFGIGNGGLPFMKLESVYNQFYSDPVTPLKEGIYVPGTTVHCFYAAKMGEEYLCRYQKYFKDPVIHRFDMEHEELLVLHPDQWATKIKEVCL